MKTIILLLVLVMTPLSFSKEVPEGLFPKAYYITQKISVDSYVVRMMNPTSIDLTCTINIDNKIDDIITYVPKNAIDPKMYIIEGMETQFEYNCIEAVKT